MLSTDIYTFFKEMFRKQSITFYNLDEFASLFEPKQFKKNDFFIQEGQRCTSIGYVFDGILRNYLIDFDGREANFRFLTKYELVAGSFGKNVKTDINIQAIENSIVISAYWKDIDTYAKNNKWLALYFNTFLADAHFRITKRMASYIGLNAKERYLLFLREYPNLINLIPQYYVANHLGITPIQLSRIRKNIANRK